MDLLLIWGLIYPQNIILPNLKIEVSPPTQPNRSKIGPGGISPISPHGKVRAHACPPLWGVLVAHVGPISVYTKAFNSCISQRSVSVDARVQVIYEVSCINKTMFQIDDGRVWAINSYHIFGKWTPCFRLRSGLRLDMVKVQIYAQFQFQGALLQNKVVFSVGNCRSVKFWKDNWCGNLALCNSFPSLYAFASSKEAWVVEFWDPSGEEGVWSPRFSRPFNDWEVERLLLTI
ncbi:hypothetical protein CK203_070905 [Vitis vinifera]|uniref:Uncharacterized protein n=1 Tax=Vitis vinifera TaxID=29760 RepID=A0A438E407_VITVI|nr:hypothetical protein CK203_070905 [Vitis vinifera]